MAKRGRKPIDIDPVEVERLAAQGLNEEQIAASLGVNWKTLKARKTKLVEFSEALKRGKAVGITQVTNALFKNALEGNVGAQIFFLKNRDPENWADKRKIEADISQIIVKYYEDEKDL